MVAKLFKKLFGSRNERLIKGYSAIANTINALEDGIRALSDDELRAKTDEFRNRLEQGEVLQDLLPEAFAVAREATQRTLGMRQFDVQLIGGMVLNDGNIAEMRTGEGKTLMATLPAYLNALGDEGVHIITVNDYLASRDARWMAPIYEFLGLSVGAILSDMDTEKKRESYAADITYGTNNQFGFDYLQDNLALSSKDKMQRGLNFAVVDEVDSILIDEARTPLIISGEGEGESDLYHKIDAIIPQLIKQDEEGEPGDYTVDEKARNVFLTEDGYERVEELMRNAGLMSEHDGLYDSGNITLVHHLNCALKAHACFEKDVHYVVANNEIIIVDEFTGRTSPGRRWSEGLHQAIEAKENVDIKSESRTVASITFQNYFRMYNKLSGMTGTADTEAFEFQQIYSLEVVVIPTHREMIRDDKTDLVYLTQEEKSQAIIDDIRDCLERKQPALVGTASIEASEVLSELLTKNKIPHQVLNAKQHEREADIIVQAGVPGTITIATNMAGRGTDIVLGGNIEAEIAKLDDPDEATIAAMRQAWQEQHQQVLDAGGLHIIGTERHESRRIDNQLRGRSGRQGDPGSSRFYLSLDDKLMRIFASERVSMLMQRLGMQDGEAIEHPWVNKAIENAQRKVEGHNFDIRKQLLEYDDVSNEQRMIIYEQRDDMMGEDDISDAIDAVRIDVLNDLVSNYIPPGSVDDLWDIEGLEGALEADFALKLPVQKWLDDENDLHEESLRQRIEDEAEKVYKDKETVAGAEVMRHFEKEVMLQVLDHNWREHLSAMSHLREGIGLRGYAAKNPKHEYKRESFNLFTELLDRIKYEVTGILLKVPVMTEDDVGAIERQHRREATGPVKYKHDEAAGLAEGGAADTTTSPEVPKPFTREGKKIGRNQICPCGSGKKYKHCHGRL
ncbi:MAG: preprotein translocase subunit SecA [Gammaproteobacteria bacterium]|nr:MAG: preprotein translocase subunit SecA [Gammaproteobacteria bacterium]